MIQTAFEVGGWAPAPGDEVVFDPYMKRRVRGSVLDYDELPDCSNPKVNADAEVCVETFRRLERQVRFGPSLFTTPQDDGRPLPRPVFDDLLSTYIEEVGHSWQEYQYEANGAGSRQRETSKAESERWSAGREYQIKRYILSLDGSLLTLSEQQRANLTAQICHGYANPLSAEIPGYSDRQAGPIQQGGRSQCRRRTNSQRSAPQHNPTLKECGGHAPESVHRKLLPSGRAAVNKRFGLLVQRVCMIHVRDPRERIPHARAARALIEMVRIAERVMGCDV